MTVPVRVVAYDPGWPGLFSELREQVDAALAGVAHVTEHVGSTAVPGLDAKPIIDLDVVVPDSRAAGLAVRALAAAGWQHEGDLGIEGREAFLPAPGLPYHHLYTVLAGSASHRDHVDFRDFLRTHPVEAAGYASLKRRLASHLETDRSAYVNGKSEMIQDLLQQARRGASKQD